MLCAIESPLPLYLALLTSRAKGRSIAVAIDLRGSGVCPSYRKESVEGLVIYFVSMGIYTMLFSFLVTIVVYIYLLYVKEYLVNVKYVKRSRLCKYGTSYPIFSQTTPSSLTYHHVRTKGILSAVLLH